MRKEFLIVTLLMVNIMSEQREYFFSSESVTEGHPDKLCDQISDRVLDALLIQDKCSRVGCEVLAAKGDIIVTGEITSGGVVNVETIVRQTLRDIGYINSDFGVSADACKVYVSISKQSADIARGVDVRDGHEEGAGDQGLMFGYACKETSSLMPLPIDLAHKLSYRLTEVRKKKILPWLRPDGKSQVTIKYVDGKPTELSTVVVSAQHNPDISYDEIVESIKKEVIIPVCKAYITENTIYHINPTGNFVIGGPEADAGLTGRKIIVDTYGGMGRHGGGCFSGKDPSKVDRSAAYMARHIAKNIVAADLADKCEVQLAYSIGVAEPVSVYVNCLGTAKVDEKKIENAVRSVFPLKPADIIEYLDLRRPIYAKTAVYGHFGREDRDFTWELTNKVVELREAVK